MVVYADVLVVLNLYINFFLLKSAALVLKRSINKKRQVFAALSGAFGALIMLAPSLPFFLSAIYKVILGGGMVFIAFGRQKIKDFLHCLLCFIVVSAVFGGLMTALWAFFAPFGMIMNNGVCYFNIPIAAIAAFTAGAYFLVKFIERIRARKTRRFCSIKICSENAEAELRGLCDTGCEVFDLFSKKPVVICSVEKCEKILPAEVRDYLAGRLQDVQKIRLIPCGTITGESLVPVFRAKSVLIDGKPADVLIGISKTPLGEDFDSVLNPEIIPT